MLYSFISNKITSQTHNSVFYWLFTVGFNQTMTGEVKYLKVYKGDQKMTSLAPNVFINMGIV